MTAHPLSPEEAERLLRGINEQAWDYEMERGDEEMTRETEAAMFQAVLYLLQARSFTVDGEARHEAIGYIERLQSAYYAPPPPDPFACEPPDDPPPGVEWEHAGTVEGDPFGDA